MLRGRLVDGLGHLIGLLQKIAADGGVGLLLVPGAAAGVAEDADDLLEVVYVIAFFTQ
jgi:hypothetical protein